MPQRIGITKNAGKTPQSDPVQDQVKADNERFTHQSGQFKFGDKVRIKIPDGFRRWLTGNNRIPGYTSAWSGQMWNLNGKKAVVKQDARGNGVQVTTSYNGDWWYPSFCLELVKPKKRVRIKEGPWDAAPCTHLRWHLMGFFREKLAVVRAKDGPSEVDIKCTKCGTTMTLKTKEE